MKYLIYAIVFFVCLSACDNNSYQEEEEGLKEISYRYKGSSTLSKKLYLVTSIDGCGACVEHTIKYIEDNIKNEESLFIISGQSKVQLKAEFKLDVRNSPNFVFDTLLLALRKKVVGTANPRVYLCRNGKIVEMKEFTYQNSDSVFKRVSLFFKEKQ